MAVHYFNVTEEEEKEYAKAIEVEEISRHSPATDAICEVKSGRFVGRGEKSMNQCGKSAVCLLGMAM